MIPLRVHLADPLGLTERLMAAGPGLRLERILPSASDLARGGPDVVLITTELGAEVAWDDLVRETVASGTRASVFVLAFAPDSQLEARAARAGAVAVLDVRRLESDNLHRTLHLAHAARRWAESRYVLLLESLAAGLVYDYRNAMAGIGSAACVVSGELPAGSQGRLLCAEIRQRADAFRDTLESLIRAALQDGNVGRGVRTTACAWVKRPSPE